MEKHSKMLDLVSKRYWFFGLSLLIILPGLVFLLLGGLRPGIDFTGGSLWELHFDPSHQPTLTQVQDIMTKADQDFVSSLNGKPNPNLQQGEQAAQADLIQKRKDQAFTAIAQPSDAGIMLVRTSAVPDLSGDQNAITTKLTTSFSITGTVDSAAKFSETASSLNTIGGTVAGEVTTRSILAVLLASLGILLYLAYAFRRVKRPFRYGLCAIIAMLHDVLVVVGVFAILGKLFGVEIDSLFVTALLTVVGFSVHDTIVVFDRIRENQIKAPGERFESLVNHSLVQTLARSLTTSLTVIFTLSALYLFGGVTIRNFVLALLIGIVSGTYSSIFNASMLLVAWENGEMGLPNGNNKNSSKTKTPSTPSKVTV
jgi:preprotein translocase subunit SecF